MTRLKHLSPLLLALAWLLHAMAAHADTVILDKVAAIVDDGVIMESEIRARSLTATQNLQSRGMPVPPADQLRQEVLNMLILESIQLQMGERAGVRISDSMLNDAIADIASRNNMTLEQFRDALAKEGVPYEDMREQVRTQMITQRVQRGNVGQKVHVTEDEVDGFLASDEGIAMMAPEWHLEHLLVPVPADATTADTERAEALANRLKASASEGLKAIADRTNLPLPVQYHDLGWRKSADIPSLFGDAISQLSPGGVAGPFHNDSGFHLVRLLERRGADHHMVQQTHARHILIKISEIRDETQALALARQLRDRALAGEDFSDLARQYSEDIGSAMEGGDLGWANPGQFVPAFEKAMNQAAVGTITEPVRSEFGWHIIQVLDRREKDLGTEMQRNMARQYLFERKYQDELAAWLVKIRDEAYVDIK